MDRDRRKYIRIDVPIDLWCRPLSAKEKIRYKTVNISGGGIRFISKQKVANGDLLELMLGIPTETDPIMCIGKVAWIESSMGNTETMQECFDVGIQFVEIKQEDRNRIIEYVFGISENTIL